jgi:serine/threonine-protein kinase
VGHPSPETIQAFLAGGCGATTSTRVERHIDDCDASRRTLSSLVRGPASGSTTDVIPDAWCPVREGEVVANKYRVERQLGAGGMGTVLAAWHLQLNQRVALKFMLPALAADEQAVARFQREARAVARLLDLDALPDGTPFLVMEFLDGETLEARLARSGPLSTPEAVAYLRQILEALQEAHQLGIVHRDLKPANLFVARGADGVERVKVLDFGIAKSVHPDIEAGLQVTHARVMVGSPPHMAPEQFGGTQVDARTDVWALGVLLYQVLTKRLPFEGATVVELMVNVQSKPHAPLGPPVAPWLRALVDACMSKRPEHRPADAAALALLLREERSPPAPACWRRVAGLAAVAALLLCGALSWPVPRVEPTQAEVVHAKPPVAPAVVTLPTIEAPPRLEQTGPLLPAPRPARADAGPRPALAPPPPDDVFGERR